MTETKTRKTKPAGAPTYAQKIAAVPPYRAADLLPVAAEVADAALDYLRMHTPTRRRKVRDALKALDAKLEGKK